MKKSNVKKEWHTPNTQNGSGDYYGTGIKNPVGRTRESYLTPTISNKNMGKPPKSLA